jgi:hypothetical protein
VKKDDEFEVVWSGTQDAAGECPSLVSAYHGGSSLNNRPAPELLTEEDLRALKEALGVWRTPGYARSRTRSEAQRARRKRERGA